MIQLRSLTSLVLAALLLAGCGAVQLRTAPAAVEICDDALISGRLVADVRSGLAIKDPTGKITPVLWPFGYAARRGVSGIELVDEGGKAVANEGAFVEISGGFRDEDTWSACAGSVTVIPAQG